MRHSRRARGCQTWLSTASVGPACYAWWPENPLFSMPGAGLEPARALAPEDFKSSEAAISPPVAYKNSERAGKSRVFDRLPLNRRMLKFERSVISVVARHPRAD